MSAKNAPGQIRKKLHSGLNSFLLSFDKQQMGKIIHHACVSPNFTSLERITFKTIHRNANNCQEALLLQGLY